MSQPRTYKVLLAAAMLGGAFAALAAGSAGTSGTTAPALHASVDADGIRQRLGVRMPTIGKIDEISATPMKGLFEVRVGNDLFYTDRNGDFLLTGELIDAQSKVSLSQARIAKLTAIDFASLPLGDALVTKQGSGARRLALFVDPNCVYCKKFESEVAATKDVTVYTFLMPILSADSVEKSRDIWCSKDSSAAWRNWMLHAKAPEHAPPACNSDAIKRNLAYSDDRKIRGTPTLVFENGARKPGMVTADVLAKSLDAAAADKQASLR